ncbi:hypothetical protein FHX77_000064 [Bifidobacterium commune]|uniref:Uncharacterized protein n=1 Tax=Bifidobacterium commune TaxID=1505727 RepID=A0A1C4H1R8_9BIFI|nr:hypothetical protein [Bifidobacterium commune]MBB2954684.1 hypothetical protein [Bifidobacterium commune]SCC78548.1 hypothetical protein GA0061077_0315 [Bifidobacterium commune]
MNFITLPSSILGSDLLPASRLTSSIPGFTENTFTALPQPESLIEVPAALIVALVVCLCTAALLIVVIALLSRPRKQADAKSRGAHAVGNDKKTWHRRIDEIVNRYERNDLKREEALNELAQTAREFAGIQTGKDMSSYTLSDISGLPVHETFDPGMKLLRQTISALYPPEFADVKRHAEAQYVDVHQAAEWVANLIERWRK